MIVLDASVVVSAALRRFSTPEQAMVVALRHHTLALSAEVDAEIAAVLTRPRLAAAISPGRVEEILAYLRSHAAWFSPLRRVTDCRDQKDNKYLELAAEAGATLLMTGDADLLVLDPWRNIRILRPADYLWAEAQTP